MRVLLAVLATLLGCCTCSVQVPTGEANPHDPWRDQTAAFQAAGAHTETPLFCIVIRTYWGHADQHGGSLRRLIRSLQRQNHQRWEAVLMVADSRPFPEMHQIIRELNETRAWVFAEWIGAEYRAKDNGQWRDGYHGLLYNLTDDAIQVCPPDTEWVLVTNGDNEYATGFMERVLQEGAAPTADDPGSAPPDIVAFDFYSRFLRPTAPACTRFAARHGGPLCKSNRGTWCHSDLGANALRWPRFQREHRAFGALDGSKYDLNEEHFDGIMMEALVEGGWRTAHVTDVCLFVHAPSVQSCAWRGGAWDDRDSIVDEGGRCVTQAEADAILKEDPNAEEVAIAVANDGNVSAFEGADQGSLSSVRCLRRRDYLSADTWGLTMAWYSEWCAEDVEEHRKDLAAFFPTPEDVEAAEQQAAQHAERVAAARAGRRPSTALDGVDEE